jgi:hypothetical protein
LSTSQAFSTAGLAARDDGLHRVVEIDGLHHFRRVGPEAARGLGAALDHLGRLHAEDGRHRAHADGHGVLHGLRAKAHQRRGLRERQHAGSHQRGVFAQRMASHGGRLGAGLGHPGAVSGDAGNQHHRLRVGGQGQCLLGAFLDQPADVLAQRLGGFGQCLRDHRMVAPGVQHADRLRALAGKNNSKRFQMITPWIEFLGC